MLCTLPIIFDYNSKLAQPTAGFTTSGVATTAASTATAVTGTAVTGGTVQQSDSPIEDDWECSSGDGDHDTAASVTVL